MMEAARHGDRTEAALDIAKIVKTLADDKDGQITVYRCSVRCEMQYTPRW